MPQANRQYRGAASEPRPTAQLQIKPLFDTTLAERLWLDRAVDILSACSAFAENRCSEKKLREVIEKKSAAKTAYHVADILLRALDGSS